MGSHTESPVRSALRESILNTITDSESPMTVADITAALGDEDAREIARLCYELRAKAGLIEFGEPRFVHTQGKDMKTYRAMAVDSAEAWAARTAASMAIAKAQAPKKAKNSTAKPASAGHPWKQPAVPPKAPQKARVTRPLPSHLQSVAPPPVTIEAPTGPFIVADGKIILKPQPQADLDAALIDALKEVLPAMRRAASDLPKAIDPPTTEEEMMTEPEAPYNTEFDNSVLKAESAEDEAPSHACHGHCANHAVEQERQAMMDAVARDLLENCRLAIVDAMLLRASRALSGDHEWQALERAYIAAAGSSLEVCHG